MQRETLFLVECDYLKTGKDSTTAREELADILASEIDYLLVLSF